MDKSSAEGYVYAGKWFATYHEAVMAVFGDHPEIFFDDSEDDYIEEVPRKCV